jgi:hypothetical protein
MIPDAEAIIIAYLANHPLIEAAGAEVGPATPESLAAPWVKVTQLDARPVGSARVDHLIEWLGAFDCFAGEDAKDNGQEVASTLTRSVREALRQLHDTDPDGAVVSGVEFLSCPRLTDRDDLDGMERYQLTANVWMHS